MTRPPLLLRSRYALQLPVEHCLERAEIELSVISLSVHEDSGGALDAGLLAIAVAAIDLRRRRTRFSVSADGRPSIAAWAA